jgi:hypothetical protein
MNLDYLHEEALRQLTGCPYSVLVRLKERLSALLCQPRVGRPFRHSVWTMLVATLVKMRSDTAYRTLALFLPIHFVTLQRTVNRICVLLAGMPLYQHTAHQFLIVDGTGTRVRSTDIANYSGHKHYKTRKVQMVVDDHRRIMAVSRAYAGSVHDKTIWDREFKTLERLFDRLVLGDKGYAGGMGENQILFRPVKHNELEYKQNKESTKAFNRELSRWRVTVEHVFAPLKAFRILSGTFSLQAKRYGTCFRAVAVIYNLKLDAKTSQK